MTPMIMLYGVYYTLSEMLIPFKRMNLAGVATFLSKAQMMAKGININGTDGIIKPVTAIHLYPKLYFIPPTDLENPVFVSEFNVLTGIHHSPHFIESMPRFIPHVEQQVWHRMLYCEAVIPYPEGKPEDQTETWLTMLLKDALIAPEERNKWMDLLFYSIEKTKT